jgi:hypothetical protein
MRRKTFADGGSVREGENEGIDSATRERARAWREMGSPERAAEQAPRRRPKPVVRPAAPAQRAAAPSRTVRAARDPEIPDADEVRTANTAGGGFDFKEAGRQLGNAAMAVPGLAALRAAPAVASGAGRLLSAATKGLAVGRAERGAERAVAAAKDTAKDAAQRAATRANNRSRGRDDDESRFADEGNPNFGRGEAQAAARAKAKGRSEGRPDAESRFADEGNPHYKRGGLVGKRGDGCAVRGLTKGRMR